jgi:NAD-dependent dihydropyrimidine dehydrogenase PreA subunit
MKIDKDNCIGCLICTEVCPMGAIDVDMSNSTNGYKGAIINEDLCTDCGLCIDACPGECLIES